MSVTLVLCKPWMHEPPLATSTDFSTPGCVGGADNEWFSTLFPALLLQGGSSTLCSQPLPLSEVTLPLPLSVPHSQQLRGCRSTKLEWSPLPPPRVGQPVGDMSSVGWVLLTEIYV